MSATKKQIKQFWRLITARLYSIRLMWCRFASTPNEIESTKSHHSEELFFGKNRRFVSHDKMFSAFFHYLTSQTWLTRVELMIKIERVFCLFDVKLVYSGADDRIYSREFKYFAWSITPSFNYNIFIGVITFYHTYLIKMQFFILHVFINYKLIMPPGKISIVVQELLLLCCKPHGKINHSFQNKHLIF